MTTGHPATAELPGSAEPVSRRIDSIDAVRGLALLGIFLVNIQSFGEPFGAFIQSKPSEGMPLGEQAAFYFVKTFCESKFYPLFSLLFGAGLIMQRGRAEARGAAFGWIGFRRLLALLVVGFLHATLFWYGDVLFVYAIAGVIVLAMSMLPARPLAITAGVLIAVATVLQTGFGAFAGYTEQRAAAAAGAPVPAADPVVEAAATPDSGTGEGPFRRLLDEFQSENPPDSPSHPVWMNAEREAYQNGPMEEVFAFRILTWAMFLVITLLGFGWHVLGMMLLGAALMREGLFTPARSGWNRLFAKLGLFVGFPLCAAAAALPSFASGAVVGGLTTMVMVLVGPLLSLGYLGGVALLADSGRARALVGALSAVGRMAFTNYLMQTLIATWIFYPWGLGYFAETTRVQRVGIVLGVFACQIVFSWVWLKVFRFGPAEWLWRSFTYLRLPPVFRGRADAATAG